MCLSRLTASGNAPANTNRHGDDVWITLRGKQHVAGAVQMTLRGWWYVSIHTGVKIQFRSK